ncbi:glycosyltransferase family 4 protein [Bacteroidota bacterium]
MNILLLTYQGDIAGSTNSITYLATGLEKKGHKVYVGCRKESLLYHLLEGSEVNLLPMTFNSRFDFRNARHIAGVVRKYDIDIVNAQSSYDRYTSVLAKYVFGAKAKVIHTRRQVSRSMGGFFQNLFYYRGTDSIVAVSEGVRKSLIAGHIPARHIKVIYNGTPRVKYDNVDSADIESLKSKLNIQSGDFVIGCVSRIKNQLQIVKALKYIPVKSKVIFVGIDSQENFIKYISDNQLYHDLYFAGIVSGDEVLNYYALFDVKVLASTQEGLSQAILESMALGTPVIATNYSGNPELIEDGYNGLLFKDGDTKELAEKILILKDDKPLREKIIEHGKETAFVDFSIEKTVEKYDSFFRELLKRTG